MEKDKSRGLKHIKDKRKYKPNSTKNPKYVPQQQKPKPSLGSNWDRYDNQEDSELPQLSSSTDFAALSILPASIGSHFQFKNEEIDDNFESIFSLNLDLLDKSVSGVAFYERVGIGKEWFEESEISKMNQCAKKNLEFFDELFPKNSEIEEIVPEEDCSSSSVESSDKDNEKEDDNVSKLIDSCSLEETNKKEDQARVDKSENNDLEQWLDDILED